MKSVRDTVPMHFVSAYMHMQTRLSVHARASLNVSASVHKCVSTSMYIYAHICTCIDAYMRFYADTFMQDCIQA